MGSGPQADDHAPAGRDKSLGPAGWHQPGVDEQKEGNSGMDRDVIHERQLMLIAVDKPNVGLMRKAQAILTAHVPNAGGSYVGRYEFACMISIFPCSQTWWTLKVAVPCAEGGRS